MVLTVKDRLYWIPGVEVELQLVPGVDVGVDVELQLAPDVEVDVDVEWSSTPRPLSEAKFTRFVIKVRG